MKKKSKRSVKNPGHTSDADKPVSAGVPAGTALKFIDEWGPRVRNWWPAIGVACTLAWVLIVWLWHVALSFPEAFVQVALAAVAFTTPVWLLYVIDTSELLNTEPVQRAGENVAVSIQRILKYYLIAVVSVSANLSIGIVGTSYAVARFSDTGSGTDILKCMPWAAIVLINSVTIGLVAMIPAALVLSILRMHMIQTLALSGNVSGIQGQVGKIIETQEQFHNCLTRDDKAETVKQE